MGLIDYWRIARRRWPILLAAMLVCAGAAAGYASTLRLTYAATSRVYVSMATGTSVNDAYQGGMAAQQRVISYVNLVTSSTLLERAIQDAGASMSIDQLRSEVAATFPPATSLIDITVTDTSPDQAKLLADKVVAQLRRMIGELETTVVGAAPAAKVTVVDEARVPTTPVGASRSKIVLLGVLVGCAIGALAAFVVDRSDRRLRTEGNLAAATGMTPLATLHPHGHNAVDEGRRLRARLASLASVADQETVPRRQGSRGRQSTTMMFTSVSSRPCPDVTALAAKALADAGRSVILIDANMTGQGNSARLPLEPDAGLAELLRMPSAPSQSIQSWADTGVAVLPVGAVDHLTPDLLASERFEELLGVLRETFDTIIVEAAPLASTSDAMTLAACCDHTVVVAELGATTASRVQSALSLLDQVDVRPAGLVAIAQRSWLDRLRGK